jgi:hypothetical protein
MAARLTSDRRMDAQATTTGRVIAWILLTILSLVNVAGYVLDLYARFWWFDRILHGCTIFAVTFWLALFMCNRVLRGGRGRDVLVVLMIASVGLAIGALWEVAEWAFDRIAPGDVIKGKHDTIIDIVMDTAGAVLAGLASLPFLRPSPRAGVHAP